MAARIGVAVVSFFCVGAVFRALASPSGGALVGAKREFLEARGEHFDTAFIGSSHVYRGFVPSEFDKLLGGAGVTSTSLNYGVQLPNLIEARFLIRELLENTPGLKRVLFEYQSLTPQVDPANAFQPRSVYWHDASSTRLAIERTLHWGRELGSGFTYVEDPASALSAFGLIDRLLPAPWRAANVHAQHYLADLLFVGRSKDVGRGLLNRQHGQSARFKADAGYISLEAENRRLSELGQADNPYSRRSRHFADMITQYTEDVQRLRTERLVLGDEEWMNAELIRIPDLQLLAQIAREVLDAGVEFILVVMPQQSADRDVEEELVERVGVPVLRYNRPDRYPELYEPAMRFDSGHLSADGALRFTRQLAHDYLRFTGEGRG